MLRSARIRFTYIIFAFIISINNSACSNHSNNATIFISNLLENDTLILYNNRTFIRIYETHRDSGNWYLDGGHIWLDGWVNRGESPNPFNVNRGNAGFSVDQGLFGGIQRIYFNVDDYYTRVPR